MELLHHIGVFVLSIVVLVNVINVISIKNTVEDLRNDFQLLKDALLEEDDEENNIFND